MNHDKTTLRSAPRMPQSAVGLEPLEPRWLFSASALPASVLTIAPWERAADIQASALPPAIESASALDTHNTHRSNANVPLSQVPVLHSNPDSNQTIFLDFDGMTVAGTVWNNFYHGGEDIHAPAFDLDGDIDSFSPLELDQIYEIWQRVAEDFAPFDIDVTTQAPPSHHFTQGSRAIRILISSNVDSAELGGDGTDWYVDSGGVARIGSWRFPTDTPAWVFSNLQLGSAKNVAESASHEAGHTFGLTHDGIEGGVTYFAGHGSGATSWAPIMGSSYTNAVTQWSRGEYDDADNTEDDLAIITQSANDVDYRADDHANSRSDASVMQPLFGGRSIGASGLITTSDDIDYFSFETDAGSVQIEINPAAVGANLDIKARLYNASGSVIATSNSSSQLKASFDLQLAAGQYFVSVEGTGTGDPDDSGYSDYASLGQYHIVGSVQPANTQLLPPPLAGDVDGDFVVGSGDLALITANWGQQGAGLSGDANGDGFVGAGDLDMVLAHWGDFVDVPINTLSRVLVPTDSALGLDWIAQGFDDSGWDAAVPSIGYETSGSDFASLIQTQLPSGTTGAYLRTTFDADDLGSPDGIGLSIRYDDGFVAYLNGVLVASANAPDGAQWDDRATDAHNDAQAKRFAWFDLTQHLGLLQSGNNTLAIHVMNQSPNSSDLLLEAEIVAWSAPSSSAQASTPPPASLPTSSGGPGKTSPSPDRQAKRAPEAKGKQQAPLPTMQQQGLAAWALQRASKPVNALAASPAGPTLRGNATTPRHVAELLRTIV